jgi:hypothetical protein
VYVGALALLLVYQCPATCIDIFYSEDLHAERMCWRLAVSLTATECSLLCVIEEFSVRLLKLVLVISMDHLIQGFYLPFSVTSL